MLAKNMALTLEEAEAVENFRKMNIQGQNIIRETLLFTKLNYTKKIVDIKDLKK